MKDQPDEPRLDSWKEIAAYLGRGIRTVQRWERDEGLPVHRLLGTRRDSLPAYASSSTLTSIEDYEEQALASKAMGYRGYKMHPPKDRSLHIPMLERVRKAVGDDFPLMYDPAAIYSYQEALKVGRVLEELGYLWFEDPLPVDDLYGYARLCADLDIMVMSTEYAWGDVAAETVAIPGKTVLA